MIKIKLSIICFLLFSLNLVQAQDQENKWALSFGVNAVDINNGGLNEIGAMVKDYLVPNDWNILPAISTVSVSRYMNYGLSVKVTGSLNKISKADDQSFFALNAAAVYDLNSLFGETGWFDPYVQLGLGGTWIDDSSAFTVKPGLGFNTWFNDKIGLNFDSTYNYGTSEFTPIAASAYFQHSVGLMIQFGGPSKKDVDGDGVADEKDLCPEAAGTKENGGCPDTDGDLVLDKDDACPNAAGTLANGGCPDADGDLVLDKDDNCPGVAGTAKNGGCPDTDGDLVLDKDDNCPNIAGPVENNGCVWPDTDGDGVADKDDQCPEVSGTVGKKGCPKLTEVQIKKLGDFSKKIEFNSGKATFKPGVADDLDGLAKVMSEYPTTNFVINGYTDSTGSEAKNLEISKKRAKAVKDHLVSQGVDVKRLKSQGFGIKNPVATNKTSKGRAKNRRVEIIAQ
jgi:outer membrane protein OmpA-like peptidoglycan-associated protein